VEPGEAYDNQQNHPLICRLSSGFPDWFHPADTGGVLLLVMATPEKVPYWKLLQRPEWQRKRLEIMQRDDFTCLRCNDKDETLNVHHSYYISGRDPWLYPDYSLRTLCKSCHDEAHADKDTQPWEEMINEIFGMEEFASPDVMAHTMHMCNVLRSDVSQQDLCIAMLDGLLRLWDEIHGTRPPLHINFNISIIKHWAKSKYPDAPVTNKQFGEP